MAEPLPPSTCPVCFAGVGGRFHSQHAQWHANTQTLDGWTVPGVLFAFQQAAEAPAPAVDETLRLPPIGETVRRRPPVPGVRELKGADLLRALADELDADDDVNGDEL